MRLRNIPRAESTIQAHRTVIKRPEDQRGCWRQVFGNRRPIRIEIGMGKGRFILEMAKKHPEVNYIGIERYSSVLLRAVEKGCRLHLALLNNGVGEETARERCSQLTEREQSVARLVAEGLTTRMIAERLGVSPRTVEVYRAGVYRKLGVRTAGEIADMLELAR